LQEQQADHRQRQPFGAIQYQRYEPIEETHHAARAVCGVAADRFGREYLPF
jgi:hypothetical protein